jgi:hypothetical protein
VQDHPDLPEAQEALVLKDHPDLLEAQEALVLKDHPDKKEAPDPLDHKDCLDRMEALGRKVRKVKSVFPFPFQHQHLVRRVRKVQLVFQEDALGVEIQYHEYYLFCCYMSYRSFHCCKILWIIAKKKQMKCCGIILSAPSNGYFLAAPNVCFLAACLFWQ